MTMFSVIIPIYNRFHLIERTLQSVLDQTYSNFEVIVIDDGSTDQSVELLSKYSNCIKILSQVNAGPGAARNLGVEYSSGEYIAFLDSDDLWFPWTLQTYADAINQNEQPSFIVGQICRFTDDKKLGFVQKSNNKIKHYNDYLEAVNQGVLIITCSSVVIKRRYLEKGNCQFSSRNVNAEDSDLWLQLGIIPMFIYISEPFVTAYREHEKSAISSFDKTYEGMLQLIEQELIGAYPGGRERKKERLYILTKHIRPVVISCMKKKQIKKGWSLYKKSFMWNLQLCRFKYLFACPIIATLSFFKRS